MDWIERIKDYRILVRSQKRMVFVWVVPPHDEHMVHENSCNTAFGDIAMYGTDYLKKPHRTATCRALEKHLELNEEYRNIGYGLYRAKINIEKVYWAFKANYNNLSIYTHMWNGSREIALKIKKKKVYPEIERCAEVVTMYDKVIKRCEKDLIGHGIAYTSPESMAVRLAGFIVWCNIMSDFVNRMSRRFCLMFVRHLSFLTRRFYARCNGYKNEMAMMDDFPAVIAKLREQISQLITKTDFSGINKENLVHDSNMWQVYSFMEYLYNNGMAEYLQGIPEEFAKVFYAAEEERHIDPLSEEELAKAQKEYDHRQWVEQVIAETDLTQVKADYHIYTDNYLDMFVSSYLLAETNKPYGEEDSPADYRRYYTDSLAKGYIEDPHGLIKNLIDGYEMLYTTWCCDESNPYDAYDSQHLYSNYDDADKANLLKKIHALRDIYAQAVRNTDVPAGQKVIFHIPICVDTYIKGLAVPTYFEQN